MNKYPERQILNSDIATEFSLQLDRHIFLYLEDLKGISRAVYFSLDLIDQIDYAFIFGADIATVKIIANEVAVKSVKEKLQSFSGVAISFIIRNHDFEVLYKAVEHKVFVTKEVLPVENLGQNISTVKVKKDYYKVLIIDDSPTIQSLLEHIFKTTDELEVVAKASLPSEAEELIKTFEPDVITLDIHMPEMNGVELLKQVISKYSIPTVVISSLSIKEGTLVLDALNNGAVDYIQKPDIKQIKEIAPVIVEKVLAAARANLKALRRNLTSRELTSSKVDTLTQNSLVVIGSSTGGTTALESLLTLLPAEIPPILIVQHIPAVFSKALADRINSLCPFLVAEGKDGDVVKINTVYIAPGGMQMKIININGELRLRMTDDPPVNRFKPSVDYMFNSISENMYKNTLGIILTGMGKDGARGLLQLKNSGAQTIAQDEDSCVVFGMPREAIKLGAAEHVVSLLDIPNVMAKLLGK